MTAAIPSKLQSADGSPVIPWWVRYTRWRQTSAKEAEASERKLLTLARCNMEPDNVQLSSAKEQFLHTLKGGSEGKPPLVCMPGYGAGTGFFFRNFQGLSSHFRLFAVDWLGTGLSGRPRYTARSREEAEDFFISSLHAWREKQGLDRFILLGHSLGGYLATCYALKYPQHVDHLVLVCPAGVPKKPDAWESRFLSGPAWRTNMFRLVGWAWQRGVTPGSFVRLLGPWGPGIVKKYVAGRFESAEAMSAEEGQLFKDYCYQIAAAPGSGEFALRHLLSPGAWAYAPLEERLAELKVPVTFIYGEHDWMRPEHAIRVCGQLSQSQPLKDPQDLRVEVIPEAGHFAFMDQPELFNRAVLAACETALMAANEAQPSHQGFTTSDPRQQPPAGPDNPQTPSLEDLATFT